MKTLTAIGIKRSGQTEWRCNMDYETVCKKYKQECQDLGLLQLRLPTATIPEYERIMRNIESKRTQIELYKKWFRFTGNKIPNID